MDKVEEDGKSQVKDVDKDEVEVCKTCFFFLGKQHRSQENLQILTPR